MYKLLVLLLVVSCNPRTRHFYEETVKEVPVDKIVEVEKVQEFEGVYLLPLGGQIELVVGEDGGVSIIRTGQEIVSQNPKNLTYANHPIITCEDCEVVDGKLVISKNVNYKTSSQYDIEEDDSGSNVTGVRKTVYTLSVKDGVLTLQIQIFSNKIGSNINFIVVDRTLTSI